MFWPLIGLFYQILTKHRPCYIPEHRVHVLRRVQGAVVFIKGLWEVAQAQLGLHQKEVTVLTENLKQLHVSGEYCLTPLTVVMSPASQVSLVTQQPITSYGLLSTICLHNIK